MKKTFDLIICIMLAGLLQACVGLDTSIKKVGKSDIDLVTDIHIATIEEHIADLVIRLYERNPTELAKAPGITVEHRLTQIIKHPTDVAYKEARYLQGVTLLELAMKKNYRNDRVFALLLGISSMLRLAYNNLSETFMLDDLDPQKLYNSARNLERILWRLREDTSSGKALLNLGPARGENSFDYTIIRIISMQDMMAKVIASKNDRVINTVIHGTATMLIPIP